MTHAGSPFLATFLEHRAALIDYATPIVGDRAHAEDVVQEAWLRFAAAQHRAAGEDRPVLQPVAYLYRIVRNLAYDLKRKVGAERLDSRGPAALERVEDAGAGPEQASASRRQLAVVSAALAELPERTRRAFHLHRFEGMTFAQIGTLLGISQSRAHGLVREALAHCMDCLNRTNQP